MDSMGNSTVEPIKVDLAAVKAANDSLILIDDDTNKELVTYLKNRLKNGATKRMGRLRRYARIDQQIVTWQKLSIDDSKRDTVEEVTGKQQGIPMNLPISQAHIDDLTAFFSEVFAPVGGNFYALPGKKEQSLAVQKLTATMNQDTLINQYYANVTMTNRQLFKYNIGGYEVMWIPALTGGVGQEAIPGNRCEALDMYNTDWDESVLDPALGHKEGEWFARYTIRNRLWLLKQHMSKQAINIDKVLEKCDSPNSTRYKAEFYRNPPAMTRIEDTGNDSKTTTADGSDFDWQEFGLGLGEDSSIDIEGFEIVRMYAWINPKQFKLAEAIEDSLELWLFTICNGEWIIRAERLENQKEIPCYVSRLNQDNMGENMRSVAEFLRPFQRFVSFLLNTHVSATRGATWGIKAIDPTMFDISKLQNGETSAVLASKLPGRDVRTGFADLRNNLDTRVNLEDAGVILELMKQFFPNQALPSQVASIDRAVKNQVSAVMQGAMRKLHMLVRLIDSSLMMPTRMQQYRNVATNSPTKQDFSQITESEVAALLSSGLGQLGREAAANELKELIFALIQNPEGQNVDIMSLFTLWSGMLNLGTDLGDFAKGATTPPIGDPDGSSNPAGADGQTPQQGTIPTGAVAA